MKFWKLTNALGLFSAIMIALGLVSCEPKATSPNPNQPPDTFITSGPRDNAVNSYFVRITWRGEDEDGLIEGFNLVVDGEEVFVTKNDSTFHFSAPNEDTQHTVSVAAVDDKGDADPTPASLTFTATNVPPNTDLEIEGDPAPGATFGLGAVFTIVATDDPDNGPEFSYRFNLDNGPDGPWLEWRDNGVIEFSATSAEGLLPEGEHVFYAQVRDLALAVDETPAEFAFVASTEVKPGVAFTAMFNSAPFYEDSSAFSFPTGNTASFTWSQTFDYAGAASAGCRYRLDGGAWTEYSTDASAVDLTDLAPGSYTFEVQCRDLAQVESDIVEFNYEIVEATFAEGVLVVDENNGQFAGRPPTTGDMNTDNFYTDVLTAVGAQFTFWDVQEQGNPTPARGMGRYSTVIWHSDEAFFGILPTQTQIAGDYLTIGGNMWITGWKPIQQISGATPVTNFDPSLPNANPGFAFVWNFMKIATTRQTPAVPADFIGVTGLAGHPTMNVDPDKNPIPLFANRLTTIDVFTTRGDVPEASTIYTFISDSGNPDFQDAVTGIKYLGSDFKVVVFGFPFYPMLQDEAIAAAQVILSDFGEI